MFEPFDNNRSRFASYGIINSMPGEMIDSIWVIIDMDLKGVIPLNNLIQFDLMNKDGKVTMHFSQEDSEVEMDIDLPFKYSNNLPQEVYAYDDGTQQTILLPSEATIR